MEGRKVGGLSGEVLIEIKRIGERWRFGDVGGIVLCWRGGGELVWQFL